MAVYNAVTTVERMVRSLLVQTFTDFEIVAVDDGSTDGSGELLDRMAAEDGRIRVIHQANAGVSAARQVGLDNARGEYTIHADADDWVEPMMLEKLCAKAVEEQADVVFCDFYADCADGSIVVRRQQPPTDPSEALRALFQQLHGSCWNKLVRRACYNKYDIRFPEGLNYCEDLLTWVQMFQHHDLRIAYVGEAFYHYVDDPASATRHGSLTMLRNIRLFTQKMAEALPKGYPDIDAYVATLPIAPFQFALQHHLVSNREIRAEYLGIRAVAWSDLHSLRGRVAYTLLDMNLVGLARFVLNARLPKFSR
jgi:glycosyltransferase involved in cell wall biosynthesis